MAAEQGGQNPLPPVVKDFDHGGVKPLNQGGGQKTEPGGWSKNLTTQETGIQETDQQKTDEYLSKLRKGTHQNFEVVGNDPTPPATNAASPAARRRSSGFTRVSETLPALGTAVPGTTVAYPIAPGARAESGAEQSAVRTGSPARGRGGPRYSEERQVILAYLHDFTAEFGDRAPLKSSVTRALHLFERSGLAIDAFVSKLYEARSLTKERDAAIGYQDRGKQQRGEYTPRNKAPYYFALLEDVLGLREHSEGQSSPPDTETALESHSGASRGPSRGRRLAAANGNVVAEVASPQGGQAEVARTTTIDDPAALWSAVRGELEQTVTRPIFETYLRGAEHATAAGGRLVVHVPSDFAAEWLDRKLRPVILQTLARLAGQEVDVGFEVHTPAVDDPG
jgi:hypothetical protein